MIGLRVALVAGTLGLGGAEKQLTYIARALHEAGANVQVFCLARGEYYEAKLINIGIPIHWFGKHQHPVLRLFDLFGQLYRFRPDIVQSTHFFTNFYSSFVARMLGAIDIGAARNDIRYSVDAIPNLGYWLLQFPRFLVTNSIAAQQQAIFYRGYKKSVDYLSNIIDLEEFEQSSQQRVVIPTSNENKKIVMLVANLKPVKRVERFLYALSIALENNPDIVGWIVGDGSERTKLESLAVEIGLNSDKVRFWGHRDDVLALLKYANVLCLTSEKEGFPNVLLEGIADTLKESIRSAGLAGGANSAARYFLVALVFLYFLQVQNKNKFFRIVVFTFIGIIILGTLVTISRTGILLLVTAIGMLLVLERGQNRSQALVLVLISLIVVWFFADNIISISYSILPSIQNSSDTMGVRYGLWQAGIRMLEAHPIGGVGIGQFPQQLPYYGHELLKAKYLSKGAHNMYIQVAAEAGLVGLLFFISLLISSLRIFWKSQKANDGGLALIGKTWLVAFVLILIGGITKHDHYDKLLWFMIGISACPLWANNVLVKENA